MENVCNELSEKQSTAFSALAARASYLAIDRPDLCVAAKELCWQFSKFPKPSHASVNALKRLARYLVKRPRLTLHFEYCDHVNDAVIYVDTDFAGCQKTRRSTSCGFITLGPHALKHWPTTQPTLALSSGEAELVAIVRGATHRARCSSHGARSWI